MDLSTSCPVYMKIHELQGFKQGFLALLVSQHENGEAIKNFLYIFFLLKKMKLDEHVSLEAYVNTNIT